jgi:uncharacterized membrane protein
MEYTQTTPPPESHAQNPQDIEENKLVAAIGYLGILCLLPLLWKKGSPYAQFHGKQGFVILVAWLILWVGNIVPFIGQIVWALGSVALVILVIMGIIHALNGEYWEMPVLGKYAKQVKL